MTDPVCPECGAPMVLRYSRRYRYANGTERPFWGCSRFPDCRATHGAHPDGAPLGKPADRETKELRILAHHLFDDYWQRQGWTRAEGYQWLARRLAIDPAAAHIGRFDADQCRRLILILEEEHHA